MSNLRNFLLQHKDGDGLSKLQQLYSIKHTRHRERPSLILFKYDQLNSPMDNPIVQESRGIILDESKDWEIVVFPYQKFFNMREMHNVAIIDWTKPVRAYQKIDGSLMTMYFSQGEWHVATSGIPDASGKILVRDSQSIGEDGAEDGQQNEEVGENNQNENQVEELNNLDDSGLSPVGNGTTRKSFAQLFWEVFKILNYKIPNEEDQRKCFMFELATPQNRVLIPFKSPKLYIHGTRNLDTLEEELPDAFVSKYGWELTPMTIINGKRQFETEILPQVEYMDGMQNEGFVICDSKFNRFKLKSKSYVNLALLHEKDELAWKRLVAILQVNEGSEFLAYFPQFVDIYNKLYEKYNHMVDLLIKIQEYSSKMDDRTWHQFRAQLPEWMVAVLYEARKKPFEDWKKFWSTPGKYKQLCGLLNPDRKPLEIPACLNDPSSSSSGSDCTNTTNSIQE